LNYTNSGLWIKNFGSGLSFTIGTNTLSIDSSVVALKSSLATVATTGAYADITGKPNMNDYQTNLGVVGFFSGSLAISSQQHLLYVVGYNNTNWDTAYGWGNHANYGYTTMSAVSTWFTSSINGSTQSWVSNYMAGLQLSYFQNDSGYITSSYLTSNNYALQSWVIGQLSGYTPTTSFATVAFTGAYSNLTGKPTLFSGSYTDLTNKPTIIAINDGVVSPSVAWSSEKITSWAQPAGNYVTGSPWTTAGFTCAGVITASDFALSSDVRLKENIAPIKSALDRINSVNGYTFDWKKNKKHDYGLLAQEVEEEFPEFVSVDENGYKQVAYMKMIPVLLSAIKELKAKVN
jgi:hypothetical protein